ncbi:PfkB family carbohydrate kinase [Kitasatospora sp. NPDC101235]|uniref:PfkB family carbohydrate kinase n=1 Tax=Kitasatospora sp. NPDC101235 TaxID=3364101 RepID=UPI00382E9B95
MAADLTSGGCRVIADLADEWLAAVVEGGAYLLKVSQEELRADHLAPTGTIAELVGVMRTLHADGIEAVLVTRAEQPALALIDGCLHEIVTPRMTPADPLGSGDSMTAGIIAGLLRGDDLPDALRLGAGRERSTRPGTDWEPGAEKPSSASPRPPNCARSTSRAPLAGA